MNAIWVEAAWGEKLSVVVIKQLSGGSEAAQNPNRCFGHNVWPFVGNIIVYRLRKIKCHENLSIFHIRLMATCNYHCGFSLCNASLVDSEPSHQHNHHFHRAAGMSCCSVLCWVFGEESAAQLSGALKSESGVQTESLSRLRTQSACREKGIGAA